MFLALIAISTQLYLASGYSLRGSSSPPGHEVSFSELNLDIELLPETLRTLSSYKSRATGYPEFYLASKYIKNYFESIGLNTTIHKYKVLVPLDMGSYLEVLEPAELSGRRIPAYALQPNLIQLSSTSGLEGELVYVRGDSLDSLDGKSLEDKIIILNFDSRDLWIDALNFGAKGIVFIERESNKYDALSKVLLTPLYAPRVFVTREYIDEVLDLAKVGARVRLVVNMCWREVEAENIIGVLEGERKDEVIIVSAHFDSFSVVPAFSPAADEASSIVALLTIAKRYASLKKVPRTVWFVALSGHWQGLAGAREFVEDLISSEVVQRGKLKIKAWINLDLSTDNYQLSAVLVGHFYKYGGAGGGAEIVSRYTWVKNVLTNLCNNVLSNYNFSSNDLNDILSNYYWSSTMLEPYIIDSEPPALAGLTAFTLMTSFSRRLYWFTPFDTLDKVNINNLVRQTMLASLVIDSILNLGEIPDYAPARVRLYGRGGPASFITLKGRVVFFNLTKGWYDPLPNALVRVGILPQSNFFIFSNIIVRADDKGEFEVHGLPVATVLGATYAVFVEGWYLNERSEIAYAPDMGVYGARAFPAYLSLLKHPENATAVVFECGVVELFDMLNPNNFRKAIIMDPTASGDVNYLTEQAKVMVYNFIEFAEPLFYGTYYNPRERVAMAFVQPGMRFTITLQRGTIALQNVGVLVNASEEAPEGSGYIISRGGERLKIKFTALAFATNLHSIARARYAVLSKHFVSSPTAPEALDKAESFIRKAQMSLKELRYSDAYSYALIAWSWSMIAYGMHTMALIYDLPLTATLFYALLIPSAFFLERLLVRKEGLARIILVAVTAAALFAAFSFVHPSIPLMTNSALGLAGILVLSFLLFVVYLLTSETSRILEEEEVKRLGEHRFRRLHLSSVELFSSVSLENLRRYRLRSVLTLASIFVITIALLSFTSSSYALVVNRVNLPFREETASALLKKGRAEPPYNLLDVYTVRVVDTLFKGVGSAYSRVFVWPSFVNPLGRVTYIKSAEGRSTIVRGLLGFSAGESKFLLGGALIAGRLFETYDYYACILTSNQAKILGVSVGDEINAGGINLTVVGILSAEVLASIKDPDGLTPTTPDPRTIPQYAVARTEARIAYPLPWDEVLLIPARLAEDLGGVVGSIAVYPLENVTRHAFEEKAKEVSKIVDTPIYISWEGARAFSRMLSWSLMGWELSLILLVLGSLNILVSSIAMVRERTRDVYIYSTLGLPPRGVLVSFIMENFIYVSVTIPIGYISGICFNYLLHEIGILPDIYVFNFSSLAAALSLITVIMVVMLSSIYPALKASGLVTPSLERRWRVTTNPRGDEWDIPLPVTTPTLGEARAILLYLNEYLSGMGRTTPYFTVISEPMLEERSLSFNVLLAPRELNITQEVRILLQQTAERYTFLLRIKRLSGRYESWRTSNYFFADALRKQMLLWRGLSEEVRLKYMRKTLLGRDYQDSR